MTLPEHLDPETTAPDLPDGYDPDGGWEPTEWLAQDPWAAYCKPGCPDDVCRSMDGCAWPKVDVQRPADFDDEERRP